EGGFCRYVQDKAAGAVKDFAEALALGAKEADVRRRCADARMANGDATAAIADCAGAIELEPNDAWTWRGLAQARQVFGSAAESIEAYTEAAKFCAGNDRDYTFLLRWTARLQNGEKEAADKELAEAFGDRASAASQNWTENLAACALGRMPPADLFAKAEAAEGDDRLG